MYPHERSLVSKLAEKPFALIGVNSDANLDEVREVVKEKNLPWRSFWNGEEGPSGPISAAWNVKGWPTIYVLDAEGRIHYKGHGGPEIDETIIKLLADMGHEGLDLSDDEHEEDKDAEPDSNEADGE